MSELPYSRITLRPKKEADRKKFWEFRANDIGKMFPFFCLFDTLLLLILLCVHTYEQAKIGETHFIIEFLILLLLLATWCLKSKLRLDTWINLVLFNLYLETVLHALGFYFQGNDMEVHPEVYMRAYEIMTLFSVIFFAPNMFHVCLFFCINLLMTGASLFWLTENNAIS